VALLSDSFAGKGCDRVTARNSIDRAVEIAESAAFESAFDPRITAAFDILDYTSGERDAFMRDHAAKTQEQILAVLNAEVDAHDTAEA
jgi:hypothetical protein